MKTIEELKQEGYQYQYSLPWLNSVLKDCIDTDEQRKVERELLDSATKFYSLKIGLDEKIARTLLQDALNISKNEPLDVDKTLRSHHNILNIMIPKVMGVIDREKRTLEICQTFTSKIDRALVVEDEVKEKLEAITNRIGDYNEVKLQTKIIDERNKTIEAKTDTLQEKNETLKNSLKLLKEEFQALKAQVNTPWYKRFFKSIFG